MRRKSTYSLGPELIAQPNDLTASPWSTGGAGATTTANAAAGPDGSVTASSINDASGSIAMRRSYALTLLPGAYYEASAWFKSDTSNYPALWVQSTTIYTAVIDLEAVDVVATPEVSGARVSDGALGGWVRLTMLFYAATASSSLRIYPAWAASLTTTEGAAATGIVFAWGVSVRKK